MRRAARLAGAEVIGRRQLMPGVFNPDMAHEAADGFQPRIALRDRRTESRPVDRCLRVDMRLPALGREGGKALQQVFRIRHREAQWHGGARDRSRWRSASERLRPGLSDLLQERDIGLGVIGRRVDAAMPEDQADLLERNAMAQHLGRRRVPQDVRPLDRRHDAGPLHEALHHRRDAVASPERPTRRDRAQEHVIARAGRKGGTRGRRRSHPRRLAEAADGPRSATCPRPAASPSATRYRRGGVAPRRRPAARGAPRAGRSRDHAGAQRLRHHMPRSAGSPAPPTDTAACRQAANGRRPGTTSSRPAWQRPSTARYRKNARRLVVNFSMVPLAATGSRGPGSSCEYRPVPSLSGSVPERRHQAGGVAGVELDGGIGRPAMLAQPRFEVGDQLRLGRLPFRGGGPANADFDEVPAKEPGAENGVVVATASLGARTSTSAQVLAERRQINVARHCALLGHDMAEVSCRPQISHCRRGAIALPFERRCETVEVWPAWPAPQMPQHLRCREVGLQHVRPRL